MSRYHHTLREGQCAEGVYVPDCLRRTGRGRYGFEMHYNYQQCSRKPKANGFCWQHQRTAEREEEDRKHAERLKARGGAS